MKYDAELPVAKLFRREFSLPIVAFAFVLFLCEWSALLSTANADTVQEYTLDTLTLEQLGEMRTSVVANRDAMAKAQAQATDARIMQDVARALRDDVDAYFDEETRPKAAGLRKSCAKKDWAACLSLANMYADGEGTWRDADLAFSLEVSACFGRDPKACAAVFWDWRIEAATGGYDGHVPFRDVLETSCEEGNADSCFIVATGYKIGYPTFLQDAVRAEALIRQACDLGSRRACDDLPKSPDEKALERRAACEAGSQFDCSLFGEALYSGHGTYQDKTRGEALIRESCLAGVERACRWLVEAFSLDQADSIDLFEAGCIADPGSICKLAIQLLEKAPQDAARDARLAHLQQVFCALPGSYCQRTVWERIEAAAIKLDPFDPASDAVFDADAREEARRLRIACSERDVEACKMLARNYRQIPEHRDLAGHILWPLCDGGNGSACFYLAEFFPYKTSFRLDVFEKACERGSLEGCLMQVLEDPLTSPQEKLSPIMEACVDGSALGCRIQADLHSKEAGAFENKWDDLERAEALYQFACDTGDIVACAKYGTILLDDAGDDAALLSTAMAHLTHACSQEIAMACLELGFYYESEVAFSATSIDAQIKYYGAFCRLSLDKRCVLYGRAVLAKARAAEQAEIGALASALLPQETDFREDYQAAVRRYRRDCIAGDLHRCAELGDRYLDVLIIDGVRWLKETAPDNWEWARALYEFACDGGAAAGCEQLSERYASGGPREDIPLAIEYATRGCDLRSAHACYTLAGFHVDGDHMTVDLVKAERLFRQSCVLGNEYACQRLVGNEMRDGDPATKEERFLLACVHGSWFACGSLRDQLRDLGWLKNRALIRELHLIACEEGDEDSCAAVRRDKQE